MLERAQGIVIRTRPLTETSLIVQWITRDQGRIATVARGARRPQSPFRGKLDLFYLADFTFARSRRSDLHNLREVVLCETHPAFRQDLRRLQQAAYGVALVEQATETDTPIPTLFELLSQLLAFLGQESAPANLILAFELRLLADAGLLPELDRTRLSGGSQQIARQLTTARWEGVGRLKLTPSQKEELGNYLGTLLRDQLGAVNPLRAAALATA